MRGEKEGSGLSNVEQSLASMNAFIEYPEVARGTVRPHGLAQSHTVTGFTLLSADVQEMRQAIFVECHNTLDGAILAFLASCAALDAKGEQFGRESDGGSIGPAQAQSFSLSRGGFWCKLLVQMRI